MGEISFTVHTDLDALEARFMQSNGKASEALANEVAKDTEPFVPFRSGALTQSTRVEKSHIIYNTLYARYLWYGKVMVDSKTGKGPAYIKGVGYRFKEGATPVPTERDLVFSTSKHPQAQARWFEGSKAQNLEKWERFAAKALTKYG